MKVANFPGNYDILRDFFRKFCASGPQVTGIDNMPSIELKYHNFGHGVVEYLTLSAPYMIMYQHLNLQDNRASLAVFTDSETMSCHSLFSDLNPNKRALHYHNFYELTFVLSGTLYMQIENTIHIYHAGDCCFCNKKIRHIERYREDCELYILMFTEEYFIDMLQNDQIYSDKTSHGPAHPFFQGLLTGKDAPAFSSRKIYYDFTGKSSPESGREELSRYFLLAVSELSQKTHPPGSVLLVQGAFCRVLALLEEKSLYRISRHQLEMDGNEQLFFNISDLMNRSHGQIDRADLEKELHYNSDYLNRVVKNYTGMTLSEYKKSFLLKEACHLLLESELTVSGVYDALGYSNHTYFNKLFSERYGMSPGQFRKKYRRK